MDKATITFAPPNPDSTRTGRDLNANSDLAIFITQFRKAIGKTFLNGSLHVKLYQELPRDDGQTVLRNRRLIAEKIDRRAKFLEGKEISLNNLSSYGILGNRFVLYLPKEANQREPVYITIAQFSGDITVAQEQYLTREVTRATYVPQPQIDVNSK